MSRPDVCRSSARLCVWFAIDRCPCFAILFRVEPGDCRSLCLVPGGRGKNRWKLDAGDRRVEVWEQVGGVALPEKARHNKATSLAQ